MDWDRNTHGGHINELFDSRGRIPDRYLRLSRKLGCDVQNPSPSLIKNLSLGSPMGDRLRIYPIPLVLSYSESQRIRMGIEQRSLVLAKFFEDVIFGRQSCFRDRVVSKKLIAALFKDEGWPLTKLQDIWKGKKFNDISLLMGSDVVRHPDGNWVVIEDNIGGTDVMLGGIADLHASKKAFLNAVDYKKEQPYYPNPWGKFLTEWREFHSIEDSKLLIAIGVRSLIYSKRKFRDKEDFRLMEVVRGIFPGAVPYGELLLLLATSGKSLIRVKTKSTSRHHAILNLSTDFRKQIYPYFILRFQKKQAAFFTGIGTEVLGSKGLLPYIDTLIKYYLGEDAILQTAPTRLLDPLNLEFQAATKQVVKRANGIQGNEVHIFPRMKSRKKNRIFRELRKSLLKAGRSPWVSQDYIRASFMHDVITDRKLEINLRPFSYLFGGNRHSSELPWGRIGTNASQPLINISQGAQELVVFDEKF